MNTTQAGWRELEMPEGADQRGASRENWKSEQLWTNRVAVHSPKDIVILNAAKNLVGTAIPRQILRCDQNDRRLVNGYANTQPTAETGNLESC
jgi:hypothetical protein